MRKVALLVLWIGIAVLILAASPASASQAENHLSAPRQALDPRLEILRSELALVTRQIESLQREAPGNLSTREPAPNRPRSIGSRAGSLDRLERRLTSLSLDWSTLSEVEASDRFHGLRLQARRLQQEVANDRFAWHRIRGQRTTGRSILPAAPYTGAITGTITEEGSGTPLANVWVDIYDSVGLWADSIQTNVSGVYTSSAGLATGNYFLRTYNYDGYINELYDDIECVGYCNETDGTPVGVTDGLTTSGIDFTLTKGGTISGNITDEVTVAGISGVQLSVYSSSGRYVSDAASDGSGNYLTTAGLPTGSYYIRTYNAQSYLDELYDDLPCLGDCTVTAGTPIAVTLGVETTGIDFELTPGGAISGNLEDGVTHLPIPFTSLDFYDATGRYVTSAYSQSGGDYKSYAGLPTGNYFVLTYNYDGYLNELYDNLPCVSSCTITDGTPVSVTLGATTTGIDFELLKGGGIAGNVTEDGTALPLDSGWVRIFDAGGNYLTSGYPDASGAYETSIGLAAGTYYAATSGFRGHLDELYDDLPCYPDCVFTDGTPITVTAGAKTGGIDFALEPGGFIAGTVTEDGSGNPLDTGYVQFYDASGDYVVTEYPSASGAYETYKTLAPGTYYARTVSFDGYFEELYDDIPCDSGCTVTDGTPITVTGGSTTSGIDFALLKAGSISGTITEEGTGTLLENVSVDVYNSSGSWVGGGSTDASGNYIVQSGLTTGTYYARTWNSQKYLNELYDNLPCWDGCTITDGTAISVTTGSATTGIDFALTPGGEISGTIIDDDSSLPLEDVVVYFYDDVGDYLTSSQTDSSGIYSNYNGLVTGTYHVRTWNDFGYINELYDDKLCAGGCTVTEGTPVSVTEGSTTSGIDFGLVLGGSISGAVTADGSGTPLDSGYVRVYDDTGDSLFAVYPDAAGSYETEEGLPSGSYFARARSFEGYLEELYDDIPCALGCTTTDGTPIAVTAGANTAGIDFELVAGGGVSGSVTDASTHVGLDSGYIRLYDASGLSIRSLYPEASGSFSTDNLPAGTYYARTESFEGYWDELYDNLPCSDGCTVTDGTPITVLAGATTTGIDFELSRGGAISGTVTDASTHLGIDTGRVNIYDSNGDWVTRGYPDASGYYFTQKPLVAGTYYALTYSHEGYIEELYDDIPCVGGCVVTSGTAIVVAATATTTGIDFELALGGLISGTVTDEDTQAALNDGYVEIYDAGGTWVTSGWTDATGTYVSSAGLPSGTYYARTGSFEGYFDELYDDLPCTGGCTVTAGTPILVTVGFTTSGVDFELAKGGLISGTVTDRFSGAPLDFGRVYIYNSTGGYVTRGYPDSSGQYTCQLALEAGTYYARTWSFEDYDEQLYSGISCALDCTITDGTPITVTLGSTTGSIDFALGQSVFADGFESGDMSTWSGIVQ